CDSCVKASQRAEMRRLRRVGRHISGVNGSTDTRCSTGRYRFSSPRRRWLGEREQVSIGVFQPSDFCTRGRFPYTMLVLFKKGIFLKSDPEAFECFHGVINRRNRPPQYRMRLWCKVLHLLDTQGRAKPIEHNGEIIFGDKLQAKNVLVEG